MQDHTKLMVWQRARALTVAVSEISRTFAPSLAPGLRAQLMRATMSIGANIAEGAARSSRTDFARFVTIAVGSATEAEHHLTVACDLGLIETSTADRLCGRVIEVRRMLYGLNRALLAAESKEKSANNVAVGRANSTRDP